eukprot:7879400-Ditylum_brightwellii.AAC.1
MDTKKKKTKRVPQGSLNPYSPWNCTAFKWIKQLAVCYGLLSPLTLKDPPMLQPPSDTKPQWIATYHDQT